MKAIRDIASGLFIAILMILGRFTCAAGSSGDDDHSACGCPGCFRSGRNKGVRVRDSRRDRWSNVANQRLSAVELGRKSPGEFPSSMWPRDSQGCIRATRESKSMSYNAFKVIHLFVVLRFLGNIHVRRCGRCWPTAPASGGHRLCASAVAVLIGFLPRAAWRCSSSVAPTRPVSPVSISVILAGVGSSRYSAVRRDLGCRARFDADRAGGPGARVCGGRANPTAIGDLAPKLGNLAAIIRTSVPRLQSVYYPACVAVSRAICPLPQGARESAP